MAVRRIETGTRLPLGLSVPHAGLDVPEEVASLCILTPAQIAADGDEGAAAIYGPLEADVTVFRTSPVARAVVDLNRAPDDFRADGVIKTHTCWNEPVYREAPDAQTARRLIETWHTPYHATLSAWAARDDLLAAVDCHTMAAQGPPVGPDPGVERPAACIGNAHGASCPDAWAEALARCLAETLGAPVTVNEPFAGGFVTRHHGREMPWLQLELSRTPRLGVAQKTAAVRAALAAWCEWLAEAACTPRGKRT